MINLGISTKSKDIEMTSNFYSRSHKKDNWLKNLCVFIFALFTDTVFFGTNANSNVVSFQRIFIIFFAIFLLFKTYNKRSVGLFVTRRNNYAIVCIGFVFLTLLFVGRLISGYYYYTVIACIIIGMCFSKLCSLEEFAKKYISFISFIALFSLIIYVFNKYLYNLPIIPTITNTSGYSYKFLVFSNIPTEANHLSRNEGPYWEAGAYQFYLNIGLLLTLFYDKSRYKIGRSLLLIATTITTFSVAAIIPMILIISAFICKREQKKGKVIKYILVSLMLIGIFLAYWFGYLDRMFDVLSEGTSSSSFAYRFSSLLSDLLSFLKSPLLGTNPDVLDANRFEIGHKYGLIGKIGITNTFAGWFALFGITLPLFMIINYWRFARRIGKGLIPAICIFGSIVAMTSNENFTSSPLLFVLPMLLGIYEFKAQYSYGDQ